MQNLFNKPEVFDSDFFISDYTNYKGAEETPVKGVDIRDNILPIFTVWPPLCFINSQHVSVLVANMEKNPAICKRANGSMCKQCECLCISKSSNENDKPWFALVELKCCDKDSRDKNRNIESNLQNAIFKLKEHHQLLRDEKGVIIKGVYRYYWIVSIPTIDEPPFKSFLWTQDYLLEISEKYDGAHIIGDNKILIIDGSQIKGDN